MQNQAQDKSTVHQFDRQDIEIIETKSVFNGFFKLFKYTFRHRLFAGGWSEPVERELLERGHAVAVLAFDPKLDEVVLVEQIRVGALAHQAPWQFEIIAGMVEEGQSPEEAARRESLEEAGLELLSLESISRFYPSSGGCTEQIEVFVAKVDSSNAGGVHGLDSEHEDILVHRVPRTEAMAMLKDGRIENASTIIALQWLALNIERFGE